MMSSFPFLNNDGVPLFQLSEQEAASIETLFLLIDAEIKKRLSDRSRAIQCLLNLILIEARRSYLRQNLHANRQNGNRPPLSGRYRNLATQHYLRIRTVKEYASKLSVSGKHLTKIVKEETGRSPSSFINEMLILEIQSLLRYSELSISEIAWQLEFTDSSHLTKFFKKHTKLTPRQYKSRNENT